MALQTLQLDIHLLVSQLQVISQFLTPVKHIMTGLKSYTRQTRLSCDVVCCILLTGVT